MWTCGAISGGGNGELAGGAAAVALHALEGVQRAVVGALGLSAEAQVNAKFRLLFLG
jgi:hypothetical protein